MPKTVKTFPTLYKEDSTGNIRQWEICVCEESNLYFIQVIYGVRGGKTQKAKEEVEGGKNIGKKNETTPREQAISQAKSRWTKQKDKYYAETIKEARKAKNKNIRPMLAKKYEDVKIEEGTPVYFQPKLDGMRCLAEKNNGVTLWSRGGKKITSVPYIAELLDNIMLEGEVWDGELYNKELDFEEITSICRKKDRSDREEEIQYHVFDVVSEDSFDFRYLGDIANGRLKSDVRVRPVLTIEMPFYVEQLNHWHDKWTKEGYEGVIIRLNNEEGYEKKRTRNLLKYKHFVDEEYEIVGAETGKPGTKKDGLLACFVLKCGKDVFEAPPIASDEKAREMWKEKDKYIGKMATVKFQNKTKYGVPRFPKVTRIRWKGDL